MAQSKSSIGCIGAIIAMAVLCVIVAWVICPEAKRQEQLVPTALGLFFAFGAIVVVIRFGLWIGGLFGGSTTRCEICSSPINKRYWKVQIRGKKKNACPNCASAIRRKISRDAVEDLDL